MILCDKTPWREAKPFIGFKHFIEIFREKEKLNDRKNSKK